MLFFSVSFCGFFIDISTKTKIFEELKDQRRVDVIKDILEFNITTNKGIVFGLFRDFEHSGTIFTVIGLAAIPIIIVIFLSIKNKTWTIAVSLAFILAGTMGNTFDRITSSEMSVRDFIYISAAKFPIFNIADSLIFVGTIILCFELFVSEEPKPKRKSLKKTISLGVEMGNINFKNPVMVASGTFGGIFDKVIDINKLGAIVLKTITLEPRKGNEPPRVIETASGMLNSIGLENKGLEGFIQEELSHYSNYDTRLIANIAGKTIDEFAFMARRLSEFKRIDALELNISCPNVSGGLDFGTNPESTRQVVKLVKESTTIPIIVKLTPNVTNTIEIARAAIEAGADAISAANTLKGIAIDWKKRESLLGGITGGLSGPAIKPVALRMIWEIKSTFPNIPIIGIGGITNANDVLEFMCAGATCVQIGTANFAEPTTTIKIIEDLPFLLEEIDILDVRSLIGSVKQKYESPSQSCLS